VKTALAVVVAFFILIAGWFFLAALLAGIGYLASRATEGASLMFFLNTLLMWILGPGFGGFIAIYVTPKIFKTVDVTVINTSFISVVITLGIIMCLITLFLIRRESISAWQLVLLIFQTLAIVVGARIGKSIYIQSRV